MTKKANAPIKKLDPCINATKKNNCTLKVKNFQLFEWKISNNGNDFTLKSHIYDRYCVSFKNADLFAIGYNPSNAANRFNEDETNLYLRNRICECFNSKDKSYSYVLMNLYNECSSKVKAFSVDATYINELIECLKNNEEKPVLLFFGKHLFKKFVNKNNKDNTKKIFEEIFSNKRKVYYTVYRRKFIHPIHKKSKFKIESVSSVLTFKRMLGRRKKYFI